MLIELSKSLHAKLSKIHDSEGISVSLYVLSEESESFERHEISVKRIHVNQGVGVP